MAVDGYQPGSVRTLAHLQTEAGTVDGQLRADATQITSAHLQSETGTLDSQLRAEVDSRTLAYLQSETGTLDSQLQALNPVATSQTITIPAATLTVDTATAKQWRLDNTDAVPIVSGLTADDTTIVLRRIVVRSSDGAVFEMRLFFAADGAAPFGLPGDDLSAQWEIAAPEAVTFAQGAAAVAIPGPGHESNTVEDTEDTYIWTPSPANLVLLTAFFNTDLDTAADLTLKLTNALDPAAPRTLAHLRSEGGILDPQLRAAASTPTLAHLRSESGAPDGQLRAVVTQPLASAYLRSGSGAVSAQLRAVSEQITLAYLQTETGALDSQLRATVSQAPPPPPSVIFAYLPSETGALDSQLRAVLNQITAAHLQTAGGIPDTQLRATFTRRRIRAYLGAETGPLGSQLRAEVTQPTPTAIILARLQTESGIAATQLRAVVVSRIVARLQTQPGTLTAQLRAVLDSIAVAHLAASAGTPDTQLRAVTNARRVARLQTVAGAATGQLRAVVTQPAGRPDAPQALRLAEATTTALLIAWDAPSDGGAPIIDYEIRVGAGAWTSTGSTAATYRLTGLNPGTAHTLTVRALNGLGAGPPSTGLTAATLPSNPPGLPLAVMALPTGERSLAATWTAPLSDGGTPITGYELCVEDEFGAVQPFEPVGVGTRAVVRGLAFGHRYGFRVRAVNAAGRGEQSPLVWGVPVAALVLSIPAGDPLPLIDTDRQSFIARVAGIDCRVRVRWQPSDSAWYADLEVPVNAPVVSGRRLTVNSGLLGARPGVLPGDLVVRALDDSDEGVDPVRDAWASGSHGLVWEPA